MVFFIFGFMGFFWTFLWMMIYRDFNPLIGNNGDEEAFISATPKV
jgi:hypothetical protein